MVCVCVCACKYVYVHAFVCNLQGGELSVVSMQVISISIRVWEGRGACVCACVSGEHKAERSCLSFSLSLFPAVMY